jgi:hypothetical protein
MVIGSGYHEFFEKNLRHFRVIMLAGMDEDLLMLLSQLGRDRGTFDKLRPGTNDGYDFHSTAGVFF